MKLAELRKKHWRASKKETRISVQALEAEMRDSERKKTQNGFPPIPSVDNYVIPDHYGFVYHNLYELGLRMSCGLYSEYNPKELEETGGEAVVLIYPAKEFSTYTFFGLKHKQNITFFGSRESLNRLQERIARYCEGPLKSK